jgi:hypothetical protein
MKYTLLQLVQAVASSLDSDEVNSINDSVESLQIANIIRTVYFDLVARADLPEHYSLFTLDPSGDITKPTLMTIPSTVANIKWVKYNKLLLVTDPLSMQDVSFMPLTQFLHMTYGLSTLDPTVKSFTQTIGADTFTIQYHNNVQPSWYTTFDDFNILFDSYDSTIDSTLQKSKTLCYGKLIIPFTLSDSFIPDLDEPQFPLLINESKSMAWMELKQSPHPIAERNSKRGWSDLQKKKKAVDILSDFDSLPNFGRK